MTGPRALALFAFYALALDLGRSSGLIGAFASPAGALLLVAAGILFGASAVRAARAPAPPALRGARVLLRAGAALALVALPVSFATRETRSVAAGEGEPFAEGPGIPALRFGEVTLAPHGPHVLSKTVEIEAVPQDGGAPIRIGLFPPTPVGAWRMSIVRFGYAPGITWLAANGAPLARGHVKLGTLEHTEAEAALVQWTPEPNVMMGAGTYPPKLEDLVSPPGTGAHLFLRLDEATIGGARRDLRDPDAHRWLADGRLEAPVFSAAVLRGGEKLFEGRIRAGESVRFAGGALHVSPDVLLWVDLLAVRDPWMPVVGLGWLLVLVGAVARAGVALVALARRTTAAGS